MNELKISDNFTVDDIHKVREYNYEQTKNMSEKERGEYYSREADSFLKSAGIVPKTPKTSLQTA
ncbi:MAG: hypothetical protein J6V90_08875 [Treponema sp.]|nr:hypothetical protein [Treponema sp.]